jgi:hypothetical protein
MSAPSLRVAAQCEGKQSFLCFAEAERIAKNVRRYREERVHPYRCRMCQHWHVGGSGPRLKDRGY